MGCYNSRSEEIEKLENELKLVLAEKIKLESMIDKKKKTPKQNNLSKNQTNSKAIDFDKIIDRDQFLTSKVIDHLNQLSTSQSDSIEVYTKQILEIKALTGDEKITKYIKLRQEESELQSKICQEIEEYNKQLLEMVYKKFYEIQERMEILEKYLKNDLSFLESLVSLEKQIESIPKSPRTDFGFLLDKYSLLDDIEKNIVAMEKSIPVLNENSLILQRFKELEQILLELTKKSVSLTKSIHANFGEDSLSNQPEGLWEKSVLINVDTFVSIPESLISCVQSLIESENIKEQVINDNKLLQVLQNLNEELMDYFKLSGKGKQEILFKMHRISKQTIDSKQPFTDEIEDSDVNTKQLLTYLLKIKEKTSKLLKSSALQDRNLLEMTSTFASFEKIIDEIELVIDELISSDIKDLYKSISYADPGCKAELDKLQETFIEFPADTTNNLFEHIVSLERKVALTPKIEKIRTVIRESQLQDIMKIKSEFNEKINQLSDQISLIENEKKSVESSMASLKINYEKTSEIADNLILSCTEKDMEISMMKHSISSAQEQYEEINKEYSRNQQELDQVSNKSREYLKNLRTKDIELAELKKKLETMHT